MEEIWKQEISVLLKELTGLEPRNFSTIDVEEWEDPIQSETVSVELPMRLFPDPIGILEQVRNNIPDSSYLVFLGTACNIFEQTDSTVELVVGRGGSQEDIIRLARTSAPNYDLDTEGIITEFAKLYSHAEIGILGADVDSVTIEIKEVKTNLSELVKALFEVCNYLCQNDFSADEKTLADHLEDNNFIILWWD